MALLGTLYSAYVIYAVGLKYLYLSLLFYALGLFFYLKGRRESRIKPTRWETVLMVLIVIAALLVVLLIAEGRVKL